MTYIISTFLPFIEGLSGAGYAARQIKGELVRVHDGGRYHDKLNLHDTIIVSVFFITINDNIAYRLIPTCKCMCVCLPCE